MLLLVVGILAACNSENITLDDEKKNETKTLKTGVIFTTDSPIADAKRQLIDIEAKGNGTQTRTSITHTPGQGADASWNSDDFIWVKNKNGEWKQSIGITLHHGGRRADFILPGSASDYADGCEVRYTGTSITYNGFTPTPSDISFPKVQSRTLANDFSKAGEWGDCGSGTARNMNSSGKFNFTLNHKAAYLCFLPRCENAALAPNVRLKKIKITATRGTNTNDLFFANRHNFDGENIYDMGHPILSPDITITLPDFPLYTNVSQEHNATYLVVAPDNYDFKIEYTIKDPTTNIETTFTNNITNITLDKGKIYDVTANLTPKSLNRKHYMWDALQHYWWGHESDMPSVDYTQGQNFPVSKENDPQRYSNYNFPGYHIRNDAQTEFFKTIPNVNEMFWYAYKGDPHWVTDNGTYEDRGHLIQVNMGGIWLKKKSKIMTDEGITEEQMRNGFPKISPTDWRTTMGTWPSNVIPSTNPVPNTTEYFYLPALGSFGGGFLYNFGSRGFYWTSNGAPYSLNNVYMLSFTSSLVQVGATDYNQGNIAKVFE